MDLKDAVLSTLAELEDIEDIEIRNEPLRNVRIQPEKEAPIVQIKEQVENIFIAPKKQEDVGTQKFLLSLRERVLVLFEGLQTVNNSGADALVLEKKLDLTINFLEFLLASIEEKIEVAQD